MRNVSRNKLLLCFRPVVVDMDQLVLDSQKVGGGVDRSKKQLSMESKEDYMKRSALSSSLSENNRCSSSENSLILHSPKKNLSGVIKAIFLGTILFKRVRDGKALCQVSNGSKHVSSMHSKKSLDAAINTNSLINIESNLVTSCSSSSPIRPSSTSLSGSKSEPDILSSWMKNSKDPNEENQVKPKKIMDNSAIYLLLIICLMATVLWGKICAIIITSVWLYFLHRGRQAVTVMDNIINSSRPENITRWLPEKKEAIEYYYKKKVIMEGLLERNHRSEGWGWH